MKWSKLNDFVLPLGIIGCLLVFLVPLPSSLMDLLLVANIAIGLTVLMTCLYVRTPVEFSVFPTVLLATTLARLVLNVATTRLILTQADQVGLSAAGQVIQQFGQFVSGDRLAVGVVIFTIIFIIQWMVITKGATRISEVAARFALDGIPGRQLAIDADLNAGLIDQAQAQARREELSQQADFYGAMDGASKFVRGDAIAGLMITAINIIGGLFIGLAQGNMQLGEATELYTKLTIGDGLASQIPALLISLAAGLLVTRGSTATNLPRAFLQQLFGKPEVLCVAGGFLALLVFTKLPTVPLLLLAAGFLGLAMMTQRQQQAEAEAAAAAPAVNAKRRPEPAKPSKRVEDFLQVDPVALELGVALVRMASKSRGGDLMARITRIREQVAGDLGLVLPSVRVRDNMQLEEHQYSIKLMGNVIAQGTLPAQGQVILPAQQSLRSLRGAVPFQHPVLDERARLISPDQVDEARSLGCQVLTSSMIVAEHLRKCVYQLSHELLTRDATKLLIEEVRKSSPTVVEELIPGVLRLSQVQQVLQGLLREGVPIRQLASILETLGDYGAETQDLTELIELVRGRLSRTISARFSDPDGRIHCVMLDPQLEQRLSDEVQSDNLTRPERATLQATLQATLTRLTQENRTPILLTRSSLRQVVWRLTQVIAPGVVVLSQDEIAQDAQIRSVGIVGLN